MSDKDRQEQAPRNANDLPPLKSYLDKVLEENKRLQSERDALIGTLRAVREDINWMTNEGKVLKRFCFNYVDELLARLEKSK